VNICIKIRNADKNISILSITGCMRRKKMGERYDIAIIGTGPAGLEAAIKGAAELAGITEYSVKELPVIEDPYLKLLSQLSGDVKMKLLKKELGESVRYYNMMQEIRELTGIQARLPYFIEIR
jgi:hypothetical protein